MGRPQRYTPENRDGVLVEITVRTIGARALLLPAPNPRDAGARTTSNPSPAETYQGYHPGPEPPNDED